MDDFLSVPPPGLFCTVIKEQRWNKHQLLYINNTEIAKYQLEILVNWIVIFYTFSTCLFCQKCTLYCVIIFCEWIPFHLCLFFLFLNHLDLAVLSLGITVAYSTRMLQKDETIKLLNTLFSKVPQMFLYFLQYIFWEMLEGYMDNSHVREQYFWGHKSTIFLSVGVSAGVCALTSWVRVSSDFPRLILWLVEPCLSDLQIKQHNIREKALHSTSMQDYTCLHFCVRVLTDLRSCRMWCWTLSMERSLAGWPSKDPLSIRCLVQALENTNTFFFSSWSI